MLCAARADAAALAGAMQCASTLTNASFVPICALIVADSKIDSVHLSHEECPRFLLAPAPALALAPALAPRRLPPPAVGQPGSDGLRRTVCGRPELLPLGLGGLGLTRTL